MLQKEDDQYRKKFHSVFQDCYDLPMFAELRVLSDAFFPPTPINTEPGNVLHLCTFFCGAISANCSFNLHWD